MTHTTRWESAYFPSLFFFETELHTVNYGAHLHDTMEIGWSLSDSFGLGFREYNYKLNYGEAVIIAPRELHGGDCNNSNQVRFASLHIPPTILEQLFASNLLDAEHIIDMPPARLIDSRIALGVYREMINSLPQTLSPGDQLLCLGNLLTRLFQVRPVWNKPPPTTNAHPAIKHVKSIINSGYKKHIDFSSLAAEVELHERYLISLFKSATGVPPHQYQIALRVERGRQMLENGISLSDVAFETGFSDQSHFNRHFKRSYGVPPGTFRKCIHVF